MIPILIDCTPWCRLPGSNLLFGLPVVLDTHQEDIKEGSRVRNHLTAITVHPRVFLTLNTNVGMCLMGSLVCVQVLLTFKGQQLGLLEVESKWAPNKVWE